MNDSAPGEPATLLSIRSKAVQAVHSPLGFFVLALLIVETFLWGSGTWFGLPQEWRITALGIGVALFLVVFFTVVWLVVTRPENLVFSEESHVQYAKMKMFGTETRLTSGRDLSNLPAQHPPDAPDEQLVSGGNS